MVEPYKSRGPRRRGGNQVITTPTVAIAAPPDIKSRRTPVLKPGVVPSSVLGPPAVLGDGYLTEEEVAAGLRVEPRTITLWRRTRGLPHIKISSKVIRFRREDVERWAAMRLTATVV